MAIVGIGVDRVVIERIASSHARFGSRFVERVYTATEYAQAEAKGNIPRRLAMLFAAKEAVAKAFGTGFRHGMAMREIEVVHATIGKPEVVLHGVAKQLAAEGGIVAIHLSLSDDGGVAIAFAVAEG